MRPNVLLLAVLFLVGCSGPPPAGGPAPRSTPTSKATAAAHEEPGTVARVTVTPKKGDVIVPPGDKWHETAFKASQDGHRAVLQKGTYRLPGPTVVAVPVVLQGQGPGQTRIVGAGSRFVLYFANSAIKISDLSVEHEGERPAEVLLVHGGSLELTNCRLSGALRGSDDISGSGLRLDKKTRAAVTTCTFEDNEFAGILCMGQCSLQVLRSACRDNGHVGLLLQEKSKAGVRGCRFERNGQSGLAALEQSDLVAEDNQAWSNGLHGLEFQDATGSASRNDCEKNTQHGIFVTDAKARLVENRCLKNQQLGIGYAGLGGGEAVGNDCSYNEMHGIEVGGKASPTLRRNRCSHNQGVGLSYWQNAGGLAEENELDHNARAVNIEEPASPTLRKNRMHDNQED